MRDACFSTTIIGKNNLSPIFILRIGQVFIQLHGSWFWITFFISSDHSVCVEQSWWLFISIVGNEEDHINYHSWSWLCRKRLKIVQVHMINWSWNGYFDPAGQRFCQHLAVKSLLKWRRICCYRNIWSGVERCSRMVSEDFALSWKCFSDPLINIRIIYTWNSLHRWNDVADSPHLSSILIECIEDSDKFSIIHTRLLMP